MYVCTGTDNECEDFEKTLGKILNDKNSSADQLRAAKAYGSLGEDNGVQVRFVNSLNNNRGGEVQRLNLGFEQDPQNPDLYRASLMVSIVKGAIGNEEIVSHEGSHVADFQDFAKTLSPDLNSWNESLNITKRPSEMRAWRLSVGLQLTGNTSSQYRACGTDKCKFTPGMLPSARDAMINNLLNDSRNGYLGLDLKLYPEFQMPTK